MKENNDFTPETSVTPVTPVTPVSSEFSVQEPVIESNPVNNEENLEKTMVIEKIVEANPNGLESLVNDEANLEVTSTEVQSTNEQPVIAIESQEPVVPQEPVVNAPEQPVTPVLPEEPITPNLNDKPVKPKKKVNIIAIILLLIVIALIAVMGCIYMGYLTVPGLIREADAQKSDVVEDEQNDIDIMNDFGVKTTTRVVTSVASNDNNDTTVGTFVDNSKAYSIQGASNNPNNSASYVEFLNNLVKSRLNYSEFYSENDYDNTLASTFVLTTNGDVYAAIDNKNPYFDQISSKYVKFISEETTGYDFYITSGYKMNINNIVRIFTGYYGNGGFSYVLFLTSDGRIISVDNTLDGMFKTTEMTNLKNIVNIESIPSGGGYSAVATDINGNTFNIEF